VGLIVLMLHYKNKKTEISCREIFDFYTKNLERASNWDLVDVSAPNIVGDFLWDNEVVSIILDRINVLDELVKSENLRKRRVAIVTTLKFIINGAIEKTLELCEKLINDEHHLIHKACGWMLSEAWKRQIESVEIFDRNDLKWEDEILSKKIDY